MLQLGGILRQPIVSYCQMFGPVFVQFEAIPDWVAFVQLLPCLRLCGQDMFLCLSCEVIRTVPHDIVEPIRELAEAEESEPAT